MEVCSDRLLQAPNSIMPSNFVESLMTDGLSAIGKEAFVLKQTFG